MCIKEEKAAPSSLLTEEINLVVYLNKYVIYILQGIIPLCKNNIINFNL